MTTVGLLLLGLLPWPLVWFALYHEHSYRLAFLLYHGLCLAAAWRWGQGRWTTWRVPQAWRRASAVSAPVAALVVYRLIPAAMISQCLYRLGFSPAHLPWFLLYFLLLQPVAEEAFWRGTIYEGLRTRIPYAAPISAFLFGSWHSLVIVMVAPGLWVLGTVAVMLFGLAMAWLYRTQEGQVLPVAIVHSLAGDLPLMVVMSLAVMMQPA